MQQSDQDAIRTKLVRDSTTIVEEELDRVRDLLWLDENGNVYLELEDPTHLEEVLARLVGHFYSHHAGLTAEPIVTTSQLGEEMGIESKVLSARLSDLKANGFAVSPERGKYKINEPRLPDILDSFEVK